MTIHALRKRKPAAADSPWLTVKQAADYLGVSIDWIYLACASKGLRCSRLGHSTLRLRREWIDAWVEAHADERSHS